VYGIRLTHRDAPFGEQILDIPVAEIESVVEPNGVGNDIWRESVAFIGVHTPMLSTSGS